MAADLAGTPTSGLRAQLCGDAHLSNFGLYATPERRLVFDINDFDETLPGPFEWDVKRLAASMWVAGDDNGHRRRERQATVRATVRAYRTAIRDFAGQSDLAVWYAKIDVEQLVRDLAPRMSARTRKQSEAGVRRAHTRDNADALRKLTTGNGGTVRFINDPPLIVPLADLLSGDGRGRRRARGCARCCGPTGSPCPRTGATCSSSSASSTSPARWSAWAASAPAPTCC